LDGGGNFRGLAMNKLRLVPLILIFLLLSAVPGSRTDIEPSMIDMEAQLAANAWDDRPFFDDSPFNIPIPDNAEIDPLSDAYVNNMVNSMSGEDVYVGIDYWSVPVFFADSSTPLHNVNLTDEWAIWDIMENVPIPDNAVPDPEEDGHLCIIDNETLIEYDFWQAEKTPAGWTANWGNMISLNSDGIFTDNWGARASGFALALGLIFPHEIAQGSINHALAYSTDDMYVKAGGPVRPATTSDGYSTDPLAIPEGTRLQLDPSIDIDSLALSDAGHIIATAMQEYGMILSDLGGGHQIYAYNPINSDNPNVWNSMLPTDEDGISWIFESKISITDFRVLKIGPQIPDLDVRTTLPPYILYTTGPSGTTGTTSGTEVTGFEIPDGTSILIAVGIVGVFLIVYVVIRKRT